MIDLLLGAVGLVVNAAFAAMIVAVAVALIVDIRKTMRG